MKNFNIIYVVILILFLSILIYSESTITKFIYKGVEFLKFGISKEPTIDTKLSNYIKINEYIMKYTYKYNYSSYVNDKLRYSGNSFIQFETMDFNEIKCLAILSDNKEAKNNNICLDLFNIKDLYWIYHNVLVFNNNREKKLIFFELIEFDYINQIIRSMEKNFENSSNNKDLKYKFSEKNLKFGEMILYIANNNLLLLNFFDFNKFIDDKGNLSFKIPGVNMYQKAIIEKKEKRKIKIKDKEYIANYYKIIPELTFFQKPFVNLNKNCLELYFLDNEIPVLAKYIYKYEINNDFFINTEELIEFY